MKLINFLTAALLFSPYAVSANDSVMNHTGELIELFVASGVDAMCINSDFDVDAIEIKCPELSYRIEEEAIEKGPILDKLTLRLHLITLNDKSGFDKASDFVTLDRESFKEFYMVRKKQKFNPGGGTVTRAIDFSVRTSPGVKTKHLYWLKQIDNKFVKISFDTKKTCKEKNCTYKIVDLEVTAHVTK